MPEGTRSFGRRKAMKLIGATAMAGIGAAGTSAARRGGPTVVRLKGSFNSPIGQAEQRERFEQLVADAPTVRGDPLAGGGESETNLDTEMVDVVMGVDENGNFAKHREQATQEMVDEAHRSAAEVVQRYKSGDVSGASGGAKSSLAGGLEQGGPIQSNVDPDLGRDWVKFFEDTAKVTAHWGTLNHNMQWYNVSTYTDDDGDEHNAIVANIASSDDTLNPYGRDIYANHKWGSTTDLDNVSLWDAGPNTTSSGTTTVSIGYPPSASLEYSFDAAGDVTQKGSPPTTKWDHSIPTNGRTWFYPGSHVESNGHSSGDDLVTAKAKTTWGLVYDSTHRWNLYFN